MKLLYIGAGFVGACSAAVAADSGHEILVYDINEERVKCLSSGDRDEIESCLHEDGLGEMIVRNQERLRFTADLSAMENFIKEGVKAVFMCLPTPEKDGSGESDLSFYEAAVKSIGPFLAGRNQGGHEDRLVIVNKSTVPIAMIDYIHELFVKQGVKNFGIVSNPEFLVEGKAIEGSVHPDRVVVGAEAEEDFKIMREIYQRFVDSTAVKYIETNPYEAAAGKLLANFNLFNRLAVCYDVVGRTCEAFPNLRFEKVREILISEPRIGKWGFYDSLYAGGSCFTKDAASLAYQLEQVKARSNLVRESLSANLFQLNHFLERAKKEAGFDFKDKKIAVLGLAFKQDTNDVRNSGAIEAVKWLLQEGVKEVRAYDPAAGNEAKKFFQNEKNVVICQSENEVLSGTAACLIATDWPQFKSLGSAITAVCPSPYLILDGRRLIQQNYEELAEKGYAIIAVGSPVMGN